MPVVGAALVFAAITAACPVRSMWPIECLARIFALTAAWRVALLRSIRHITARACRDPHDLASWVNKIE